MKKLSIAFLVLILLSAMCFFAYLLYQKKNTPQTQTKNETVSDYQYIFIDSISEYNKSDNTDQDISDYDKPEQKNVYIPIPKEKSAQYKAEIEKIIDEQVPLAIKEVDEIVLHAKDLHDKLVKNGYNFMDYRNLQLNSEICIWHPDIALDAKLIKYTQEKYFGEKYDYKTRDDFYEKRDHLYRHFKENNVNTQKLEELLDYEAEQNKIIEGYIKHIEDTILPPEPN